MKNLEAVLELRDGLLLACREDLLGVATAESAALVAHIEHLHLFDLDDEASPS